jgi:hypothetical protein
VTTEVLDEGGGTMLALGTYDGKEDGCEVLAGDEVVEAAVDEELLLVVEVVVGAADEVLLELVEVLVLAGAVCLTSPPVTV